MKTKRWFSMVLCMLLLSFSVLPTTVFAAERSINLEMDHYTLELNPDTQTATVTNADSTNVTEIEIPETVTHEGVTYTVTAIGNQAFRYQDFKTVKLPNTITSIGERAFQYCRDITNMNIPTSLKTIGEEAFWSCTSWDILVEIPEGVTEIPSGAFQSLHNAKGLIIPTTVKTIENSFKDFGVNVQTDMPLIIPTNVISIEYDSFVNSGFSTVTIADGRLETLELKGAFRGMKRLESAEILSGMVNIGANEFQNCQKLSNITLADGITNIGRYSFGQSTNNPPNYALSEVVIPDSVTSMGNPIFDNCLGATIYYPSQATAPSTFKGTETQVGYTVNADGTVTIDSVNGIALDTTPENLKGKKISAVPEEYKAEGKHFHYFRENELYCAICGKFDPNHVHSSLIKTEKVEATCTTTGKEAYYTCEACHKHFSDAEGKNEIINLDEYGIIPVKEHTFGKDWLSNENKHWHECDCGAKADEGTHTFKWVIDKKATEKEKGSKHEECSVCGYKKASVEIPVLTPTNPDKPNKPIIPNTSVNDKTPETGDQTNLGLFTSLLTVSALGIAVLAVLKKKKALENK